MKPQTPLTTYRASDRRVFNGAPCSDIEREWNHTAGLEARMKALDPTSRCTYFPVEGKYLTFTNCNLFDPEYVGCPEILTGNMHACKQLALIEAIELLMQR